MCSHYQSKYEIARLTLAAGDVLGSSTDDHECCYVDFDRSDYV